MIADKIGPHHLERKAILYVRQSSAHQVLHNRESGTLQYAMRDRLTALGFAEIEVIDDDLGRSAAGGVQRAGFERMVAEVCLGKVGAVCAREVSRFARNSRDWQQLIEMCRVVDTVLVDQETIYAPRHGNDRLLLGLKGSLNEYELDLLRQRSLSARYEKARPRRSGFKTDMQPAVSLRQSLDRPLDRQWTVLDIAEKPDFSRPAPFRDRNCVPLLGDIESHKSFAMLSHGPPSVHEGRLGPPEQPSFLPARKGGPPAQPANDV